MAELPRPTQGILLTHQDLGTELRCYLRDPDGHLIEVGQTTVSR